MVAIFDFQTHNHACLGVQEECGAQMKTQRAWQEHVDGYKTKLKAKIINSVRWDEY